MSAPWKDDQLMEQQQELMKLQAALDIQVAYSANLRRSLLKATTVFALDHVNRIAFEKLCSEAPSQSLLRHDAGVVERVCAKLVPWNESGITSKDQLLEMVMV
jgi:hypothetical protein